MNHVILIGRVGKDPEIRTIGTDSKVANLTLATSRTYKNAKGEKVEDTQWHNLKAWKGLAGIIEKYVKKGDKIMITGQIEYRSFDGKDGAKKYITEITVENMEMLGSPRQGAREETHQQSQPAEEVPEWLR